MFLESIMESFTSLMNKLLRSQNIKKLKKKMTDGEEIDNDS